MASFVQSVLRLLFKRSPPNGTGRVDEEQGGAGGLRPATVSSTLGGYSGPPQGQVISVMPASHGMSSDEEHHLTIFRLMLGINKSPQLGFNHPDRPADNIGLYARVVFSEQKSKDSYKVFSVVINACYLLQIIIAAALTALGAANADNKAITAFGAFNTILAGLLTYLKGSGLPSRLKYNSEEWKKVREFIEQRERDFSHDGCTLDVYEVVELVRQMYVNTKREIQMNTPDSFHPASYTQQPLPGQGEKVGGVDVSKFDDVASKLRSLDGTVRNLKAKLEKTGHDARAAVHDARDAAHGLHDDAKRMEADIGGFGKRMESDIGGFGKRMEADIGGLGKRMETDIGGLGKRMETDIGGLGKSVMAEVEERKPHVHGEVSVSANFGNKGH